MVTKFPSEKELKKVRKKLDATIASRLLPDDASVLEKTKFHLCEQFVIFKNENHLSQRDLSEQLWINEALMSKILHYHFDEFTIDRLVRYLSVLYPEVDLEVKVA